LVVDGWGGGWWVGRGGGGGGGGGEGEKGRCARIVNGLEYMKMLCTEQGIC